MVRFILGDVMATSLNLTGFPVHAGSPAHPGLVSPITGWPARGPMLGMTCPEINVCYAADRAAAVFRTTNGGATWQPFP